MILPISLLLIPQTPSIFVSCLYNVSMCIIEPIVILDIWLGLSPLGVPTLREELK